MSSNPVYRPAPAQDQQPDYCDYYSFMTYADFTAWVTANDGSRPKISWGAAA